jgi:hypothetical protein
VKEEKEKKGEKRKKGDSSEKADSSYFIYRLNREQGIGSPDYTAKPPFQNMFYLL